MNPELQRNLWLETSPRRLGWAGLAVVLIYGAAILLAKLSDAPATLKALGLAGQFLFFGGAYVWAVRNAGGAVMGEIGQRTWDFQRLSAISPWAMTWGKLVGATSLAWVVALSGLVVAAAVRPEENVGPTLISAIAVAVLMQAVALWASLVGVRKARAEGRLPSMRSVAGGFFIALIGLWLLSTVGRAVNGASHLGGLDHLWAWGRGATMNWWDLAVPLDLFAMLATLMFAAWALTGAWRLMRLEMLMRNSPWVWVGFLAFLALFVGGLVPGDFGRQGDTLDPAAAHLFRAVAVGVVLLIALYASAFVEPADRVRLRLFGAAARRGQGKTVLELTPLVVPALIFTALAAIVIGVSAAHFEHLKAASGDPDPLGGPLARFAPLAVAAGFLFVLRDIGVIFFFRFGPRPRRGDFAAVVGLVLVYLVTGAVASSLGGTPAKALLEMTPAHAPLSLAGGAVQAAVVWWLTARRIAATA